MAAKYKIHPRHASKDTLISFVNGKAVNLTGKKATKVHPKTLTADQWDETIPGATQADLKVVYEGGMKDVDGYPIVVLDSAEVNQG